MKLLMTAFVLGAFVAASTVSWALPPKNSGGARCQCSCRSATNYKDLDWQMKQPCGLSDGHACHFTLDGGRTFQSGTLRDCQECRAGDSSTEWICKPSWLQSHSPAGSLQQAPSSQPVQGGQPSAPSGQLTPH